MITKSIQNKIDLFKIRMETEKDFCTELFDELTIRLMALKYAYYIESVELVKDHTYDMSEQEWYAMGLSLGRLEEGDTSPCIDFDYKHPKADEAVILAKKLMRK